MIGACKVTAIRMGLLKSVDESQIVYLTNMGRKTDFPVWTALVQSEEANILVDLGIYDPEWASKNIITCVRESFDHPEKALQQAAGISPGDIDYVIFTHLHWDHIGESLRPFTKARFVVQESEWWYMHQPVSYQAWAYKSSLDVCLDPEIDFFRWHFVNGWTEFLPGIKLVPTPGHTPGHQAVLVKTEEGRLMLTGDAMNSIENLTGNLPSGITSNGDDYMTSMGLIRRCAERVLGAHDRTIQPFQTDGFPEVEPMDGEIA